MIYFIHGVFSGPEIWNSYLEENEGYAISLYSEDPLKLKLTSADILVGYSMGGRIAMEMASKHDFKIKKLILLAAHPGLDPHERKERKEWEDKLLAKMENSSIIEFLDYWNSLPLFSQSKLLALTNERFQRGRELFNRYRLSQQDNFLPQLKIHQQKVLYIYGAEDSKYSQIAHQLSTHQIPTQVVSGDHRIYLNQTELHPILQEAYR